MAEPAAPLPGKPKHEHPMLRSLGLGLITGAADDDCAAVGTYAQAGAHFGYNMLWTAPLALPMMIAVVYLSAKMGQVTGQGLFSVLRRHAPRWLLLLVLAGVIVGNIIEAGADLGGMTAAIQLLVPLPQWAILLGVTGAALAFQIWGSYTFIRNVLRVLAMSLLAYVASALLAHPNLMDVVRGTLMPHVHIDRQTLAMTVAIIGASISAYIFTWQSNEEVEEKIASGRHTVRQRRGSTPARLRQTLWDVIFGMAFANIVMYFIMLATAATLFTTGHRSIESAADVAMALRPVAGRFATVLFAVGIMGWACLPFP